MAIPLIESFELVTDKPIVTTMQVADVTARDAISSNVRWEGMQVYCLAEAEGYVLSGGLTNSDWVQVFPVSSGGLADGDYGDIIVSNSGITVDLSETGVVDTTYGSSTQIPVFTVDIKGRILEVTDTPLEISFPIVTSGTSEIQYDDNAPAITIINGVSREVTIGDINTTGFITVNNNVYAQGGSGYLNLLPNLVELRNGVGSCGVVMYDDGSGFIESSDLLTISGVGGVTINSSGAGLTIDSDGNLIRSNNTYMDFNWGGIQSIYFDANGMTISSSNQLSIQSDLGFLIDSENLTFQDNGIDVFLETQTGLIISSAIDNVAISAATDIFCNASTGIVLDNGGASEIVQLSSGFIKLEAANIILLNLPASDYVDDAAASAGGVPIGGLYHTAGVVKVRL